MNNHQQALHHMKRAIEEYEIECMMETHSVNLDARDETLLADMCRNNMRIAARQAEYHNRKSQEYFHYAVIEDERKGSQIMSDENETPVYGAKRLTICKRCGAAIHYDKRAPHMPITLHGRYLVFGKVVTMCEDKRPKPRP